jgi:multiple sugar transport system permease protein
MSLHDWPLLGTSRFIGLDNYRTLVHDTTFWNSLLFTTKYTLVVTPIIFVVAFVLALLVRQRLPGVGLFRTAFFLPSVVGFGAVSLLWLWMFNDQVGVFDGILQGLGLIQTPIEWLTSSIRQRESTGLDVWQACATSPCRCCVVRSPWRLLCP